MITMGEELETMQVTYGDPYRAIMDAVNPDGNNDPQGIAFTVTPSVLWDGIRLVSRQTAWSLLARAKAIGVTPEQWEQLRQVAAEVAPD